MTDLPIVCTLTPETLATVGLNYFLVWYVKQSSWNAIARTIAAERLCCRFLRFEMIVEPDGGPCFFRCADQKALVSSWLP